MLVLERIRGERIVVAKDGQLLVTLTVTQVRDGKVKLGFCAPSWLTIDREEVYEARIAKAKEGPQSLGEGEA